MSTALYGAAARRDSGQMRVTFVTEDQAIENPLDEVPFLLLRDDGFTWVDVPEWSEEAESLLGPVLGCHPLAVEQCRQRNHVPTLHGYADHFFVVLHTPLLGKAGHVHLLELDQIVGTRFLVTVHGPINPALDTSVAVVETDAVLERIRAGRLRPRTPGDVSYAIGTAIARRQRFLINEVAEKLPGMEQRVMGGDFRHAEDLLEELFLIRHELLTARTMSAQSHDVYARLASLDRHVPEPDRVIGRDLADQFDRVRSVADGEAQFLFGVIDLYQTRVTTKMTVAMERLAVIAAVTLPITAIASVYGMNVIVNEQTHVAQLVVVLAVMALISALLLRWTHKQGWW